MKKVFFLFLVLFVTSICFTSCEKDDEFDEKPETRKVLINKDELTEPEVL